MTLEGVPKGYEAVRFANPAITEWYVDTTGTVKQCVEEVGGLRLIVRKTEPVATWIHGVFNPGYVAEDQNGDQFWYDRRPNALASGDSWQWPDGRRTGKSISVNTGAFASIVEFRRDLPWHQRIVAVGPGVEGGAT